MNNKYLIHREDDSDKKYGVPELKKFPMPDADHVRSAIKFFNYIDSKYEEELAKAILERMKEYGLTFDDIKVGEENRFIKYVPEKYLAHHGIKGMEWGKHNGPPYPLDYDDYSAEEKRQNPRGGAGGSGSGSTNKAYDPNDYFNFDLSKKHFRNTYYDENGEFQSERKNLKDNLEEFVGYTKEWINENGKEETISYLQGDFDFSEEEARNFVDHMDRAMAAKKALASDFVDSVGESLEVNSSNTNLGENFVDRYTMGTTIFGSDRGRKK